MSARPEAEGARPAEFRTLHPLAILAVALIVLPFAMRAIGYPPTIAVEIAIFAMVALGYNLLLGYTGLLSFGHGLFFGLGAYATALSQLHWLKDSLLLPLAFTLLFCALLGGVIGFLVLRRRGVYFSLLTLAFTVLAYYLCYRWTSLTGGENGLSGITRPALLGIKLDDNGIYYWLVAAIVLVVAWLLWRVTRSPFGSVLVAIREKEQRARFLGYSVRKYKWLAFLLSALVVALGGSLYALLKLFVSADTVHVNFSGEIVAMTIVGGTRHFLGPALGALFYILFREALSSYTAAWQFWFGLLFMAFILFSPRGLIGLGARLLAPLRRVEETAAAMATRVAAQPAAEVPAELLPTPSNAEVLLRAEGIVKRFDAFTAVDGVSLALRDRHLHALIGPNGAGKTTLFNVISGMFAPESGQLTLLGTTTSALDAEQAVQRGIARSFQITNLFPELTVWENLRLGVQARHRARLNMWHNKDDAADINAQTAQLIAFLGLQGIEQVPAASLSYGGQRLLEIGLALSSRPALLLLDEPLAGLAAAERERIVKLIQLLAKHIGVLVVEHDIDRVFAFADQITVMAAGKVLLSGSADQVRADAEVQRVYLGSGRHVRPRSAAASADRADTLLELSAVNTFYGKSHILHEISLRIARGQVTALLGRNGAGKSSTFKTIMGLAPAASGRVSFAGQDITALRPEQVCRLGIGLVPQGRRLFAGLTVAENLKLGALAHSRRRASGVHWSEQRIFEYFPRLRDKLNTKADLLSGGEQQMVAIARTLSGNVKLLLLDEPFEGLAPAVVQELFDVLDKLRREVAIFVVDHDLDLTLALADQVFVLDRGRVCYDGSAQPLLNDLEFRKQVLWM